jgi:hypothetical protein
LSKNLSIIPYYINKSKNFSAFLRDQRTVIQDIKNLDKMTQVYIHQSTTFNFFSTKRFAFKLPFWAGLGVLLVSTGVTILPTEVNASSEKLAQVVVPTTTDPTPVDQSPTNQIPVDQSPTNQIPVNQTPATQTPAPKLQLTKFPQPKLPLTKFQ